MTPYALGPMSVELDDAKVVEEQTVIQSIRVETQMIKSQVSFTAPAHILVVDDHEDSRDVARMVLEHAGYEVSVAETGTEAFQLAVTAQPDLVLMDIVLPEIDGLEVSRRLRNHAVTRDMRIVAVTAVARGGIRDEALLAGCNAFLPKPYHVATLRTLVFEQLLLGRLRARARALPI